ncbi:MULTISPECIES: prepilin peptidase [Streptomyces]|uniref:A24 family peptidase n=1 Tax=Streptomyces doebereineriae TaxID=3075528 RepID=A0ABU2VI94_9ACTN|nr:A24 family peptidase [Streptomyces sp. DSM 41640]MDT0485306.1 A24 family peptidase [Streptomyces sp. DSM 41640]
MAVLWGAGTSLGIPRAAHRLSVPPEEPWRTACPAGHRLDGIGNGWLGRARCTAGDTFGPSMPIITLVMTVVCAVLAATTGPRPELLVWLLLAPIAVLLSTVDFAVHRLPDVVAIPLAGTAIVGLGGAALLPNAGGSWRTALLGSLTLGACYFVLFLINPRGFGFGDVKLAPALGAVLGWYSWGTLLIGTFAGFLLGALYGVGLILSRRAGRKTAIPFGPFLLAGAFVGILLGSRTL